MLLIFNRNFILIERRRSWVGFWQTNGIQNILVVILRFPIYCLSIQILNSFYASALKNKPPMVVTVHKLKPMEFFCLLGYSMIYIWIGNSKGSLLKQCQVFLHKISNSMIIQIHKNSFDTAHIFLERNLNGIINFHHFWQSSIYV